MATVTIGNLALVSTEELEVFSRSSTLFVLRGPSGYTESYSGVGFTYSELGVPTGGTVTGVALSVNGQSAVTFTGLSLSASQLATLIINEDEAAVRTMLFGGSDMIWGSNNAEQIAGGDGDDTIISLEGNDSVTGQAGADDVNGNVGFDLVRGGEGNDTVRGGRDNDTLFGDAGDDAHVNGNIGDDVVNGGLGHDTVYGGQGADTLHGDEGNDLLSGDLGNDALAGGAGADRFTIRAGGGTDWVVDFSFAQGDRILLAPGTAYTAVAVSGQVGIQLAGGEVLALSGVAAGSFSTDWLVFG
jgi:Ca2+-binding RTX toxin-like protein